TQISEAGDGGDDQALQAAATGVQYRRASQQDQEGADHRRDGQALRQGRTRPQDRLTCREPRGVRPVPATNILFRDCPRTVYFSGQPFLKLARPAWAGIARAKRAKNNGVLAKVLVQTPRLGGVQ